MCLSEFPGHSNGRQTRSAKRQPPQKSLIKRQLPLEISLEELRITQIARKRRTTSVRGENRSKDLPCWSERPNIKPAIHNNCHEKRSNGPIWTNAWSRTGAVRNSRTLNCDNSQRPTLVAKTGLQPTRPAIQNANGVTSEKITYIGRMSSNGG